MLKRIKWTKLALCLTVLSVAFASVVLVRWCAEVQPAAEPWKISTQKALQTVNVQKINVNTATKEELMLLPEIGETLAQRIIAYREENGPYQAEEELLQVRGVGEKTLEKVLDYIVLEEVQP